MGISVVKLLCFFAFFVAAFSGGQTLDNVDLSKEKELWKTANAVCFAVDYTVSQDENIYQLAKESGTDVEVEELTMEINKGEVDFRQALISILNVMKPTRGHVQSLVDKKQQRLTPYAKELVSELHRRNKDVYLISGGFRSVIEPIANDLNISMSNVFSNRLKFYFDGEYAGFDDTQFTSRSHGKAAVIKELKDKHGYKTVVMVGDGITDSDAAPFADLFIGFGGSSKLPEVKDRAKWFVTDFRDLIKEL